MRVDIVVYFFLNSWALWVVGIVFFVNFVVRILFIFFLDYGKFFFLLAY